MTIAQTFRTASLILISLAATLPLRADGPIKIASGQKIAFLGDSITQFGWQHPGGYVKLVVACLDSVGVKVEPIPAGIGGQTSRDMVARIAPLIKNGKPDWMTLSCGVNDVWHGASGVDLETYKQNITSIVDQAKAGGTKVIILTSTPIMENDNPFNQKLVAYNDFLRQLAKERNLPLVDLNATFWSALKANPPPVGGFTLTVDGVHMNADGNILMARGILEALGVSSAQVDQFEATWRKSDDATFVAANMFLGGTAGVSIPAYNNLVAVAQERKLRPVDLENQLYFNAIREVLKAHEQDPEIKIGTLGPEYEKAFAEQVKALPAASPALPPTPTAPKSQ